MFYWKAFWVHMCGTTVDLHWKSQYTTCELDSSSSSTQSVQFSYNFIHVHRIATLIDVLLFLHWNVCALKAEVVVRVLGQWKCFVFCQPGWPPTTMQRWSVTDRPCHFFLSTLTCPPLATRSVPNSPLLPLPDLPVTCNLVNVRVSPLPPFIWPVLCLQPGKFRFSFLPIFVRPVSYSESE